MNVSCPECGSVFRVDPSKVPQAGVRARCSICGGVIAIGKSGVIDEDFASPATAMAAVGSASAPSISAGVRPEQAVTPPSPMGASAPPAPPPPPPPESIRAVPAPTPEAAPPEVVDPTAITPV
ncbi:MAG TPA: zinc-ribbon domain-containing protein, partial [Gemmatimonadaceae bacterium]|nr:zinc-ribbon domain-containing protein [Gemmatimonadaceae bacterium]